MKTKNERQRIAILRALHDGNVLMGSAAVADAIRVWGFEMSPRSVRLHLNDMEQEGLVVHAKQGRNGGRSITEKGVEELKTSRVLDRVGFTAARVDLLSWKMTFDIGSRSGNIVLNITTIDEGRLGEALEIMTRVFDSHLCMGKYMVLAHPGEFLGEYQVPTGKIGIGTVCSVTLNGALLRSRIPTVSRFGGVLEVADRRPVRFTDVIYYDWTTLDPLEIFIKGGLTNVSGAVSNGYGKIGASFREVPSEALPEIEKILDELDTIGLGGVLTVGKPNQPLLDFPVHQGRTGIIVMGGLNPIAAVEESGIKTTSAALSALFDFNKLVNYKHVIAPPVS